MSTSSGPMLPGFWKCVKCGTPNPVTVYISACVACGFPRPPAGFESRAGGPPPPEPGPRPGGRSRALMVAVASYGLVL